MATAYSGEVSPGGSGYNRIRLRVEYSGTSATCYIEFRRTSTWTDTWSDSQASITFNGVTVSAPYSYSGTVNSDWRTIDSASGFSVSTSGDTYSWSFNNPTYGSVLGCSGTITIPSQQVAPTTPTVSVAVNSNTSLNVTWGTSSFGVPNTGTAYIYSGTSASPTQLQYTKTTTGTNMWTNTGLTPNTKYYYRARAKNTADLWSSYSSDATGVTKATGPTVTPNTVANTSIKLNYSVPADGGFYTRYIKYSTNNGSSWTTAATASGTAAKSGTFTISGLTTNTSYTIKTKTETTSGSTNGSTVTTATYPATPTTSLNSVTSSSIKINYSIAADGNAYPKKLQYSINNTSNWVDVTTISTGSASSGSFTVSNLSAYTDYTIYTRILTTAGSSGAYSVAAKTSAVAPSGGAVAIDSATWDTVTLTASITSYGAPANDSSRKLAIGVSDQPNSSTYKRENQPHQVLSATTTVTNDSIYPAAQPLTLCGCLTVYAYIWAYNGVLSSTTRNTTPYYLPPAPLDNITLVDRTDSGGTSTIQITVQGSPADGTHNVSGATVYSAYRYSEDNGTTWSNWIALGNDTAQAPDTVNSATITGTAGADMLIEARQRYQGQYSEVLRLSVPYVPLPTPPFYGSVNGESTKIKRLYGPVNGQAKKIVKLYGSVNGSAKIVFEDNNV